MPLDIFGGYSLVENMSGKSEKAISGKELCLEAYNEIFFSGSMPRWKKFLFDNISNPLIFTLFCMDVTLRGISQVFLCDHPVSGILILFGLGCTSTLLVAYSVLGTICGTLGAFLIARPDIGDITSGLCGYDGALVGCACWAFFVDDMYRPLIAAVLAFTSGFVHVSCANCLKTFGLPTFTFAFNLVTIAFLLGITTDNSLATSLAPAKVVVHPKSWTEMSPAFMVDASIRGVGQFMFADTTVGSLLVIIGIGVSSRIGALAAWLGGTVGGITAYYILNVNQQLRVNVRNGLFGYNSAGACASIAGGVFFHPTPMGVVVGAVTAAFAVLVNIAFMSFWGTLWGLPVLTFPFITSTWIIMITRSAWLVPLSESKPLWDGSGFGFLGASLDDIIRSHCLPIVYKVVYQPTQVPSQDTDGDTVGVDTVSANEVQAMEIDTSAK